MIEDRRAVRGAVSIKLQVAGQVVGDVRLAGLAGVLELHDTAGVDVDLRLASRAVRLEKGAAAVADVEREAGAVSAGDTGAVEDDDIEGYDFRIAGKNIISGARRHRNAAERSVFRETEVR